MITSKINSIDSTLCFAGWFFPLPIPFSCTFRPLQLSLSSSIDIFDFRSLCVQKKFPFHFHSTQKHHILCISAHHILLFSLTCFFDFLFRLNFFFARGVFSDTLSNHKLCGSKHKYVCVCLCAFDFQLNVMWPQRTTKSRNIQHCAAIYRSI